MVIGSPWKVIFICLTVARVSSTLASDFNACVSAVGVMAGKSIVIDLLGSLLKNPAGAVLVADGASGKAGRVVVETGGFTDVAGGLLCIKIFQ